MELLTIRRQQRRFVRITVRHTMSEFDIISGVSRISFYWEYNLTIF